MSAPRYGEREGSESSAAALALYPPRRIVCEPACDGAPDAGVPSVLTARTSPREPSDVQGRAQAHTDRQARVAGARTPHHQERQARPRLLRVGAAEAPDRAGQAAGVGTPRGPARRRDLRRARRRRQGRHHQARHRGAQPPRLPRGRAPLAHRPRAVAVVLPALRRAAPRRRRDRALRPLLVQPRRRRARHGLRHSPSRSRSSSATAPSSSGCSSARASPW